MADLITILIILLAVGGASWYLYKAKKRGQTCVGCPHSKQCSRYQCNNNKK